MPRRQTKGHDIRFWGSNYRMISNHTTQPMLLNPVPLLLTPCRTLRTSLSGLRSSSASLAGPPLLRGVAPEGRPARSPSVLRLFLGRELCVATLLALANARPVGTVELQLAAVAAG